MPAATGQGGGTNLMQILRNAGFSGSALETAYAVMMAESGGNFRAHNGNAGTGDNSYGLFQINMLGAMGPERLRQYGLSSYDDLFDPVTNARVAYRMSNGGKDWSPWSTYKRGDYKRFLGDVSGQGANFTQQTTAQTYQWGDGAFTPDPVLDAPKGGSFAPQIRDFADPVQAFSPSPTAPGLQAQSTPASFSGTSGGTSFRDKIITAAMAQLGVDYSWGGGSKSGATYGIERGANTKGFDCSGLLLYAFAQAGYSLPRLSWDQLKQGRRTSLTDLRPGDLVGFRDGGHIALYIGNGQIIEAPRTGLKVRVRKLGANENAWGVSLTLPGD